MTTILFLFIIGELAIGSVFQNFMTNRELIRSMYDTRVVMNGCVNKMPNF